jgi:DNA-binding CsgD family transcriptional regulator
MQYVPTIQSESINEEYDITLDNDIMDAHEQVLKEIQRLKKTRQFSSARIYELYWCEGDDTLQELADKIGISKSTVFIHLKRVRQHLKGIIKNPFV